ncbi:hypothetical protein [Streptomyces sp. NPDC056660]|uniref:hypothetical protein n=1 Tax=Streptomyces sp. NPDC056660 TaxID=3345897 RepID=UPI0036C64559
MRIWRDLGTASRHGVVNPGLGREIYGRSPLGIAEQPTFVIRRPTPVLRSRDVRARSRGPVPARA